ncbi:MAG: hypothetical protein DRR42_28325 [Gammaproteobacteria bacterium]|nr:MAG: hypothetical protein DRR42_28325 [Gammaproteobacteria bacterium]
MRFGAIDKEIQMKTILTIILVIIATSACEPEKKGNGTVEHVTFQGRETRLKIPYSFVRESTVPWTSYETKPSETVSSIILERKLRSIEGLEVPPEVVADELVFLLAAKSKSDEHNFADILDKFVALANESENIVLDEESGLFRVYEGEFTFYWLITDIPPPVSSRNVIASCTSDGSKSVRARCGLIEFSPQPDIGVDLSMDVQLLSQYELIKDDITQLVRGWEESLQYRGER